MTTRAQAMEALRAELRGAEPHGLDALSPADLESLTQTIRDTKRRQSAALRKASEDALRHVPALLRGPIRRILG